MKIAILGTGMAGFGASLRLREEQVEVVLYEKNSYYGGHTASHRVDPGFIFDEGPHVSFTKDERIQNILVTFVVRIENQNWLIRCRRFYFERVRQMRNQVQKQGQQKSHQEEFLFQAEGVETRF